MNILWNSSPVLKIWKSWRKMLRLCFDPHMTCGLDRAFCDGSSYHDLSLFNPESTRSCFFVWIRNKLKIFFVELEFHQNLLLHVVGGIIQPSTVTWILEKEGQPFRHCAIIRITGRWVGWLVNIWYQTS